MATINPGPGRNIPDQETQAGGYPVFESWFSNAGSKKVFAKRTASRPRQLKKKPKNSRLNIERIKLGNCAKKYGKLTKQQRKVWKTICVRVERHVGSLKHSSSRTWQVKGRLAFMSSCLLGYIRSCDRQDTIPDVPPDTLIDILMFHFKIVDINNNPINKANVAITSHILREKDGSDKVMFRQITDVDGYPPDFGMASNFQPYNVLVSKVYESQSKTVNVTQDTQVNLVIC